MGQLCAGSPEGADTISGRKSYFLETKAIRGDINFVVVVHLFQPALSWRRYWSVELASFVDVVAESPDEAAKTIVMASLRHNLKPDDITVIVAKVVVMASKL